jgi:hypothetical protein
MNEFNILTVDRRLGRITICVIVVCASFKFVYLNQLTKKQKKVLNRACLKTSLFIQDLIKSRYYCLLNNETSSHT